MLRRWVWWSLLLGLLGGGGAVGWHFYGRPVLVSVARPERGPAVEAVYATGVVEPVIWTRVETLATGRLQAVLVREGDRVAEGQVLARLDDGEPRARIDELEARVRFLRQDAERADALARSNVAPTLSRDRARMELEATQAALAGVRDRLKEYVLLSPLAGQVLRRDAEPGDIARTGTILFWIGRPRPLWAVVEVDEEDIPQIRSGQEVLLKADAFPSRALAATVAEIRPKGDTVNKSYRVRLALPDDTPLMIGMTVEANIVVQRRQDALLLPDAAVLAGKVLVVEDGIARARAVTVGVNGEGRTEIRAGLDETAAVILAPPAGLQDGARVRFAP